MSDYRDIQIEGMDEVQAVLGRLQAAAIDLTPWFKAVGEHLVLSHTERWDAGKDSHNDKWVDLKPATWDKKKNPKMLFESNTMLGVRGASYNATSEKLEFGLADEKAGWHHFGTQNRQGKEMIPSRELIGWSDDDKQEVIVLGKEHLEKSIKK